MWPVNSVFFARRQLIGMTFPTPNPYTTTPPNTSPVFYTSTTAKPNVMSGNYILTAPQYAIPGFNFSLGFESFMDSPITLEASIFQVVQETGPGFSRNVRKDVVKVTDTFYKGQPGMINLPVPGYLTYSGSVYWSVKCLAGQCNDAFRYLVYEPTSDRVSFLGTVNSLPVQRDITTIFVQTDKAIYKPGQMVHYRVFAVYPDLKLYSGNFWIEVNDPNGNKIQHMTDVPSVQGVVEGSLGLADQPVFGDWVISVRIETATASDSYSKPFTVNEYQLPRFEVIVDVPSYALITDTDIHGTVKATYTFGQPVKGLVELHVSPNQGPDFCGKEPQHMELSFDIDGEAKFSVPKTDISQVASVYQGSQIKVKAIVKEALTDVRLEGSAVIVFQSTPYKVKILDNTPNVFKPGLPYSIFAKVSMQDDTPVGGDNNTLTMVTTAHYSIPSDNSFLYGTSSFTGTYPLPIQNVSVPPNGVIKIDLDIPANATSLDVTVDFRGITDHRQISKMFSISSNYLQLSLLGQGLKSRDTARLQAKATEPMGKLWYQVLSRGMVCESKIVDTQGQHEMTFDIALTPMMSPTAHVMAYYVRRDGEIIPDSIAFNVDGIFSNEVTISMSTNKSEPHTDIDVYLKADPESVVHLLAVDQSVLLIKSGNDVSPAEVAAAVGTYDRGDKPSDSNFALSLSRINIMGTLQGAGVNVYSDIDLSRSSLPYQGPNNKDLSIYGPEVLHHVTFYYGQPSTDSAFGGIGTGGGAFFPNQQQARGYGGYGGGYEQALHGLSGAMPPGGMGESAKDGQQPLKEVERVRNLFPETWLWLNTTVGANGSAVVHTTVPDTITSWVATAFATNLRTGLGVSPSAFKLTVFRSFFVSLTLPTSVIRGEHVVVQASIFNYLPSDVSVLVTLPGSNDYNSIVIGADGSETTANGDQERTVMVKSNGQVAVYFPIIPTQVGAVDIEVSARSTLSADAVRRQLIVEAEGVPSEFSIPVFVNLDASGTQTFSQTFPVTLPSDVVDGSTRSRIKVTGDLLGPSVDGLENLLSMPTGCGEQNMIRLAPDLYIANYLTSTGQMTPAMQQKIKYLLETGYQRQLTYQRADGAFSSFGNKDETGSTWLTAFVLRVFHEARPYVFVDSGVLQRSLSWIIQRQNTDGSFNEFGTIFDPEMRQFQDHSAGLTSFVLLALLENKDVPSTNATIESLRNVTSKALAFLETKYQDLTDDLSLALTSLALAKAKSPAADQAFTMLSAHAITEHGMTYWKSNTNATNKIDPYIRWRPTHVRARPIDIQITSYALLVYAARGMFHEGMGVLHWLTRQRNPYGGFSSTQDTIVGLQAMTQFVQQAVPSGFDLHMDVKAGVSNPHFDISPANSLVLQAKDLSFVPSEVTFNASGKGVAVAELDVFFHVETDVTEPAFDVSTVLLDDYLNSFKVMICTRWLLAGDSGMVVQEVGIPSGFAPDMSSVGNVAGIKRVEQKGRFLDVYFEKISKNSVCYTVMFDRQSMVAHSQMSYVVTQDYYEPTNRATVSYQSLSLRDSTVCSVCPKCCGRS